MALPGAEEQEPARRMTDSLVHESVHHAGRSRRMAIVAAAYALCCTLAVWHAFGRDSHRTGTDELAQALTWPGSQSQLSWPSWQASVKGAGLRSKAEGLSSGVAAQLLESRSENVGAKQSEQVPKARTSLLAEFSNSKQELRETPSEGALLREEASDDYNRDVRLAEQAEKTRTLLKTLSHSASPALARAISRARSVLRDDGEFNGMEGLKINRSTQPPGVAVLQRARNILTDALSSEEHGQMLAGKPRGPELRGSQSLGAEVDKHMWAGWRENGGWKHKYAACWPHCAPQHNFMNHINYNVYPYNEENGGHVWKKWPLPAYSVNDVYRHSEHEHYVKAFYARARREAQRAAIAKLTQKKDAEAEAERRMTEPDNRPDWEDDGGVGGAYKWTGKGGLPEKNVYDHIPKELYPGPYGHKWRHDDRQGYYYNVMAHLDEDDASPFNHTQAAAQQQPAGGENVASDGGDSEAAAAPPAVQCAPGDMRPECFDGKQSSPMKQLHQLALQKRSIAAARNQVAVRPAFPHQNDRQKVVKPVEGGDSVDDVFGDNRVPMKVADHGAWGSVWKQSKGSTTELAEEDSQSSTMDGGLAERKGRSTELMAIVPKSQIAPQVDFPL